ncbi:MAG TPA: hypothetical protein VI757_10355, partial [Bacteroidia bacterium]|nr:hypothetical protein [Bacteroidia bacterium]
MKKVLLGFILCASLGAQGQSSVYHPFPDSNAIWMETVWWMFPSNPPQCGQRDYVLFISGDTIIGSYSYKKILSSGYSHMCPFGPGVNYYSNRYVGAFRQDTSLKQVFYVPENSSIENLLYDFNLNVGDTLPVTYNSFFPNVYVTSIDSILTGSDYRKLYWLSIERGWGEYAFLIEGIGSSYGLLNRFEPWFESGSYLRCFTLEQQTIYQDSNFTCNLDVSIAETSENISSVIIFP